MENLDKKGDDAEAPYKLLTDIKLNEPIESFCFMKVFGRKFIVAANGNLLSIIKLNEGTEDQENS